jgi:hypothetical protein
MTSIDSKFLEKIQLLLSSLFLSGLWILMHLKVLLFLYFFQRIRQSFLRGIELLDRFGRFKSGVSGCLFRGDRLSCQAWRFPRASWWRDQKHMEDHRDFHSSFCSFWDLINFQPIHCMGTSFCLIILKRPLHSAMNFQNFHSCLEN